MNIFKKMFSGGDIKTKGLIAWGTYKNFYVTARQDARTYGFTVGIAYHAESEGGAAVIKDRIRELLMRIKAEQKQLAEFTVEDNYIQFMENSSGLAATTAKKINENLERIISILQEEGCVSGCELCGGSYSVNAYNLNGKPLHLCADCRRKVEQDMERTKEELRSQKSNPVLGILGAVAGSALGVALWVFIYQLGYIAGIAGAAIMLLAYGGYIKLGRAMDTKGAIFSLIIGLAMIFVACHISWTIEAIKAYKDVYHVNMNFFYMYRRLFSILDRMNIVADFIKELVIGYGLSLLVAFPTIISSIKESRGSSTIKQL